jgi:sulfonate transport system substrate-binding protein
MPDRRMGFLALGLLAASAALSTYAAVRGPLKAPAAAGPGRLALDAPLPTRVPPGTRLVIGDPMTEVVLKHTGWDRELPFQAQWAEITGGPGVTEAFHAKALDVGSGADMPSIHAAWVGIPVKIVAVRLKRDPLRNPFYMLGVSPKAHMDSLADLRGKRIAYSPGQAQGEVIIRALMSQHLTPRDVTLVELPSTSADVYVNALVSGSIDVAPLAGAAVKRYIDRFGPQGAKVLPHGPARDDFLTLFVREETLQDPAKAAALRAYIRLWGRAQAWMSAHPDELGRAYFIENQGLSPDLARYAQQIYEGLYVPRRWDEAVALQQSTVDLMAEANHRPRFDAARIFDRRFEAVAAQGEADLAAPAMARIAAR